MARHSRGQGPRAERGRGRSRGLILTEGVQAPVRNLCIADEKDRYRCHRPEAGPRSSKDGRDDEQGYLPGSGAGAAMGAVMFATDTSVQVDAVERLSDAAHPGQEQTGENDVDERFGDDFHGQAVR